MMQRNCLRHWVLFWYLLITRCIGSRYWIFGFTMTILQIWCQALNCLRLAPTTLMKSSLALAWRTLDALTASSSKCNVWPQSRSRVIFPLSLMQLENESPTSKEHWSNTQLLVTWKQSEKAFRIIVPRSLPRSWKDAEPIRGTAWHSPLDCSTNEDGWGEWSTGNGFHFAFWPSTCKSSIHPVRSSQNSGPRIFQVVSKKPGFCLFSSLFPSRSIWGLQEQLTKEGYYSIYGKAGARTEMPGCSLCMGNQVSYLQAVKIWGAELAWFLSDFQTSWSRLESKSSLFIFFLLYLFFVYHGTNKSMEGRFLRMGFGANKPRYLGTSPKIVSEAYPHV